MSNRPAPPLSPMAQLIYAAGSAAFTMSERLIILYMPFYFIPPAEEGVHSLIPTGTHFGVITVLGAALLLGRLVDAVADPVIAAMSDRSRARMGRRRMFMLLSALPLAVSAALVFYPPRAGAESLLNGGWLALMMCLFYVAFTAYVNPYLALMSEVGHTSDIRINLSTGIAAFGLLGMVVVMVAVPALVSALQGAGMGMRESYRVAATGVAAVAAVLLCAAALSLNEPHRERRPGPGLFMSLRQTLAVKPFRTFLAAEVFLQFSTNLITLGMLYFAVVIFRRDQGFMAVLAGVTIGVALISMPAVNAAARRLGKKRVMLAGVLIMAGCCLTLFLLSWNMTGTYFYAGLLAFSLAGLPLAILATLVNPTVADLARVDALGTGIHREAMFFGARAVPMKLTVAMAGVTFAFLLSAFGKDVASPLGVQLTTLVAAVSSALGYLIFRRYPEDEVRAALMRHGDRA